MDWIRLLAGENSTDQSSHRSTFERDFDRIVFSHPFRRLQDKTQVFPLPEQDFVHTRLTHSLEVSSVGRSLGKKVGEVLIDRYETLASRGTPSMILGPLSPQLVYVMTWVIHLSDIPEKMPFQSFFVIAVSVERSEPI